MSHKAEKVACQFAFESLQVVCRRLIRCLRQQFLSSLTKFDTSFSPSPPIDTVLWLLLLIIYFRHTYRQMAAISSRMKCLAHLNFSCRWQASYTPRLTHTVSQRVRHFLFASFAWIFERLLPKPMPCMRLFIIIFNLNFWMLHHFGFLSAFSFSAFLWVLSQWNSCDSLTHGHW